MLSTESEHCFTIDPNIEQYIPGLKRGAKQRTKRTKTSQQLGIESELKRAFVEL